MRDSLRAEGSATFPGQKSGRRVGRRIGYARARNSPPSRGRRQVLAEGARLEAQEKLAHGASTTQSPFHLHDPISFVRVTYDAPPAAMHAKVRPKRGFDKSNSAFSRNSTADSWRVLQNYRTDAENVAISQHVFDLKNSKLRSMFLVYAWGKRSTQSLQQRRKYPPAKPGALGCEPLIAAAGSLTRPRFLLAA